MNTFSMQSFIELFDELIVGKTKEEVWVIDSDSGEGVLRTIEHLSAEEASIPVKEGGTTIAAHTEHLRWSLNFSLAFLEGKTPAPNWEESWKIKTVNDTDWREIRRQLQSVYEAIRKNVEKRTD